MEGRVERDLEIILEFAKTHRSERELGRRVDVVALAQGVALNWLAVRAELLEREKVHGLRQLRFFAGLPARRDRLVFGHGRPRRSGA